MAFTSVYWSDEPGCSSFICLSVLSPAQASGGLKARHAVYKFRKQLVLARLPLLQHAVIQSAS